MTGWLLLDAAFEAYNLWWLLQPDTRRAFRRMDAAAKHGVRDSDTCTCHSFRACARCHEVCGCTG